MHHYTPAELRAIAQHVLAAFITGGDDAERVRIRLGMMASATGQTTAWCLDRIKGWAVS